jgi:spore maturation protein CgeB
LGDYYQYLKEDDNYTFYWDRRLTELKKNEIKNIFYMPHFVNTAVYKNLNLKTEYDLMFAGRLDTDFRLDTVLYLMRKFEHLDFAWFAIEKHYEDALSRVKTPKDAELIQRNYRGFIDTEEQMAVEINKTKIVFNFNAQALGALNYRTFQVIACEKLLLSDYREEAKELFSIGENFVCFNTIADLEEKINYYLNNENEYKKITKAGRKIVEKNYSSSVCVDKMLKSIL